MKKPLVTSLSMSFKRATTLTEDVEEAKKEHRQNLKMLVDDYLVKVQEGKADGIRNAKELVEVMKMDLLLMGEATERTETNELDDIKLHRVSQLIDEDDPNIQAIMKDVMMALNNTNDEADNSVNKKKSSE
jgi:hypothetical protein